MRLGSTVQGEMVAVVMFVVGVVVVGVVVVGAVAIVANSVGVVHAMQQALHDNRFLFS